MAILTITDIAAVIIGCTLTTDVIPTTLEYASTVS
jgi:hypothetical protein